MIMKAGPCQQQTCTTPFGMWIAGCSLNGRRTRLISSAYRCFLITHAHLDHINGLVVSAGSLAGPRKRIYAVEQTLKDIASVFNDRIWPNLASWNEEDDEYKLLYST